MHAKLCDSESSAFPASYRWIEKMSGARSWADVCFLHCLACACGLDVILMSDTGTSNLIGGSIHSLTTHGFLDWFQCKLLLLFGVSKYCHACVVMALCCNIGHLPWPSVQAGTSGLSSARATPWCWTRLGLFFFYF